MNPAPRTPLTVDAELINHVLDRFKWQQIAIRDIEPVRAAIEEITTHPDIVSQGVDFILIAKNLERVADHATNIAEDVILATQARNVKHAAKLES